MKPIFRALFLLKRKLLLQSSCFEPTPSITNTPHQCLTQLKSNSNPVINNLHYNINITDTDHEKYIYQNGSGSVTK